MDNGWSGKIILYGSISLKSLTNTNGNQPFIYVRPLRAKIGEKMFCPECKSLMFPSEGHFECRKCGHKIKIEGHQATTLQETAEERETLVIEGDLDTLPKTRMECPSCKNKEAYWVLRQMRAADEPETRIYRCTKCNHTWRES